MYGYDRINLVPTMVDSDGNPLTFAAAQREVAKARTYLSQLEELKTIIKNVTLKKSASSSSKWLQHLPEHNVLIDGLKFVAFFCLVFASIFVVAIERELTKLSWI